MKVNDANKLAKPTVKIPKKDVKFTAKETIFLQKVKCAAKHAREIGAGTRKGNPIKNLMNDL